MIATAASKIRRRICEKIKIDKIDNDRPGPVFPNNVKSKWPAIIFAASRTARVPGRIIFLTVSINTINGIRAGGVPWGTKCANICCVWFTHPKNIRLSQRGKERDRVITICLDLVNTYGKSPKKLLNTINLNNLTNKVETPMWEEVSKALNSLCKVWIIFLQKRDHREGDAQYK